ncbi:hypothetical protein [Echinicola shivajiensis]|uniref:hypothetical protein n=1 Tax=Echinicola shivajiensis TaxID=1035916 RepID=UPI001BFC68FC|nr:hypothetical protein [Echinicola shivajiensis]
MREFIELLGPVSSIVIAVLAVFQLLILYWTFRLAANSINEFKQNQRWKEKRELAAKLVILLGELRKKIYYLHNPKFINRESLAEKVAMEENFSIDASSRYLIDVDYYLRFYWKYQEVSSDIIQKIEDLRRMELLFNGLNDNCLAIMFNNTHEQYSDLKEVMDNIKYGAEEIASKILEDSFEGDFIKFIKSKGKQYLSTIKDKEDLYLEFLHSH